MGLPRGASAFARTLWRMTWSTAMVSLYAFDTWPSCSFAVFRAAPTWSSDRPMRFGTGTGVGPSESTRVTLEPVLTETPSAGCTRNTTPSATLVE